jgi:uncharacterized OsmC-like protein
MLFESEAGEHTILTDVPMNMGGADRAPKAPELFVASLGACIGSFVVDYCQRAGVDTRDMAVEMSFDGAQNPVRLVNLRAKIVLPHGGEEAVKRREAILKVAEHCTLHETIAMWQGMGIDVAVGGAAGG